MDISLEITPEPNTPSQLVTDQRKWTRLPPEIGRTTIYDNGHRISAGIVDESFGGLGLILTNDPGFAVGREIRLLHHGFMMKAVVRYTETVDSEHHRLGVEWC